MSGKVYTRNDLIHIRNESEREKWAQKFRVIADKRKELIKEKLIELENKLIKAIEDGYNSVFITEKLLRLPPISEDIYFPIQYTLYVNSLKKSFPECNIKEEESKKLGLGIFIDFLFHL